MRRDVNIELLRIMLMFGIIWLHCCQQGGRFEESKNICYLMRPCVVCFVFLSGWFAIRGNFIRKFLRLIFLGFICAFFSVLINKIYSAGSINTWIVLKDSYMSLVKGYWFLWAYIGLMALAPILNSAVEGEEKSVNTRVAPLLIMIFIGAFLSHIPVIKNYIPQSAGITSLSCLMMSAVYVVARVIQLRGYERYLYCKWFLILALISIISCYLGFSHYASPFGMIVAVFLFAIVRKIQIPKMFHGVIIFIAPSMFAVYLIHQAVHGFSFVREGMQIAATFSSSAILQTFIASVFVFITCLLVDLLRRGHKYLVSKVYLKRISC